MPQRQDQSVHRDPRDAGQGRDARRDQPLQLQGPAGVPLHGLLDLLELHRPARNRAGEDRSRRAVRQGLLHRLRRDHRGRRGGQYRQGPAGRQCRRVRARRDRAQRHPGRADGGRRPHRRGRHQRRQGGMGPAVRDDRLRQSQESRPTSSRTSSRCSTAARTTASTAPAIPR